MKKRLNAILAMLLVLILLLVGCTSSAAGDVSGQLGESRAVTNSEVSEEPLPADGERHSECGAGFDRSPCTADACTLGDPRRFQH